jgi:hypothetical protein
MLKLHADDIARIGGAGAGRTVLLLAAQKLQRSRATHNNVI